MAAINPIPVTPPSSTDAEAQRLLGRQAARASRPAPARTTSNGNGSIGGKSVSGGARVRGSNF